MPAPERRVQGPISRPEAVLGAVPARRAALVRRPPMLTSATRRPFTLVPLLPSPHCPSREDFPWHQLDPQCHRAGFLPGLLARGVGQALRLLPLQPVLRLSSPLVSRLPEARPLWRVVCTCRCLSTAFQFHFQQRCTREVHPVVCRQPCRLLVRQHLLKPAPRLLEIQVPPVLWSSLWRCGRKFSLASRTELLIPRLRHRTRASPNNRTHPQRRRPSRGRRQRHLPLLSLTRSPLI